MTTFVGRLALQVVPVTGTQPVDHESWLSGVLQKSLDLPGSKAWRQVETLEVAPTSER